MAEIFVTSDLHLGHHIMLRGQKIGIRPFETLDEMHDALVARWNDTVRAHDKVYVLGDVTLQRKAPADPGAPDWLSLIGQLNGHKRLVLGNHDHRPVTEYLVYFEKVMAMREFDGYIMTHVPVHTSQLTRWTGNIHGHTHANVVLKPGRYLSRADADMRYVNACVEVNDYTPQPWGVLKARVQS